MDRIGSSRTVDPALPRLEVRDLQVVLALSRAGSTSAAARVLHITQSAVSRALGAAEAHAGATLFERTSRGLVPTRAGTTLLEGAPTILAELRSLEARLREPPAERTRLRIAAACYMAYPWLTHMVLRLRASLPDLRLELPIRFTEHTVEALREGKLDAALITHTAPADFPSRPLFNDELVFFVATDHPLARQPTLRPKDLADHVLLVPNSRSDDAWFMKRVFRSQTPRLRVERLPVTEAIVELARTGAGVGVLSEWVAGSYFRVPGSGLVLRRLSTGPLRRRWRLAHRPGLEPLLPPLIDAIKSARPLQSLPARDGA
ncbi:MAG: LysR family transcriptional regulator [Myxococcota bacterium]